MLPDRLAFESPFYLLLGALLPAVWWIGRRSLAGLGTARRRTALALRSLVVALLVAALAEVQLVRTSDRVAVLYLVDQSQSVPAEKTAAVIEYINRSTRERPDARNADRAGVIIFGRDAAVETPPLASDMPLARRFESTIDCEATNLAGALRLARAAFPPDCAKRVVIISDGNQNVGDATTAALALAEQGVGIDVIPLGRIARNEVAVEKLALPPELRQSAPFEGRVVLTSTLAAGQETTLRGRLSIARTAGSHTTLLSDQGLELTGGKRVFSFRDEVDSPDFYTYVARFTPDGSSDDRTSENNEAGAFTQVRGRGQVLLIEDWSRPGRFADFVAALERADLSVTVEPSDRLFANLTELQRYDVVVLADVGRTSGDENQKLTEFPDAQLEMLARNTQQLGGGLLILGGPDSFGAGGWSNTALERAAPVDFQIKSANVVPAGGLVIVLDRSGSMTGKKLQMSKAAASAAVEMLGEQDQVGVVAFDSEPTWVVPIERVAAAENIKRRIARIAPGGGTNLWPAMLAGYEALRHVEAAVKHMVVLTDGRTEGEGFEKLAQRGFQQGITTSAVAVGKDSAADLLNQVARSGNGKFYAVDNPRVIPRIFMKEAMRVARPLVYEEPRGFVPEVALDHEITSGIDAVPSITGFVMTTPKDNPLVEIALISPKPAGQTNVLLAAWQYGLGRSVVLTTDVGQRWTRNWSDWAQRDSLLSQIVRWAMRPADEEAGRAVFAEAEEGVIQVVVTALDRDDRLVNFLELSASVVGPNLEPAALRLSQTAPGRYVGQLPAGQSGTYLLSINSPSGRSTIRTGVNVPYSAEFKHQETDTPLLRSLAKLVPRGGRNGAVIAEPIDAASLARAQQVNVFRRDLAPATSRQNIWPTLVFAAACLFFLDVLNRRVAVSLAWLPTTARRLRDSILRRPFEPEHSPSLERLRSRKSQVEERIDRRRVGARFETQSPELLDDDVEPAAIGQAKRADKTDVPIEPVPEVPGEEDYTVRLLKAKRRVWEDRKPPPGNIS